MVAQAKSPDFLSLPPHAIVIWGTIIGCHSFVLNYTNLVLNTSSPKQLQMKKSSNYKVLDIVKHYNIDLGVFSFEILCK